MTRTGLPTPPVQGAMASFLYAFSSISRKSATIWAKGDKWKVVHGWLLRAGLVSD